MSEDVARMVGAAAPNSITINGKSCFIRPLTLRELTEIQRECLRIYRQQYAQNLKDTEEILGVDEVRRQILESAKWDVDDLPKKFVYDAGKDIEPTEEIFKFIRENLAIDRAEIEKQANKDLVIRQLLTTALDSGVLSETLFEKLTGRIPRRLSTGYVNWWLTATIDGMVSLCYWCLRDQGITKDDVIAEITSSGGKVASIARDIESLSAPDLGNG